MRVCSHLFSRVRPGGRRSPFGTRKLKPSADPPRIASLHSATKSAPPPHRPPPEIRLTTLPPPVDAARKSSAPTEQGPCVDVPIRASQSSRPEPRSLRADNCVYLASRCDPKRRDGGGVVGTGLAAETTNNRGQHGEPPTMSPPVGPRANELTSVSWTTTTEPAHEVFARRPAYNATSGRGHSWRNRLIDPGRVCGRPGGALYVCISSCDVRVRAFGCHGWCWLSPAEVSERGATPGLNRGQSQRCRWGVSEGDRERKKKWHNSPGGAPAGEGRCRPM